MSIESPSHIEAGFIKEMTNRGIVANNAYRLLGMAEAMRKLAQFDLQQRKVLKEAGGLTMIHHVYAGLRGDDKADV